MKIKEIIIPEWLMEINYNGKIIPNGKTYDLLKTGANCQVFAYYILRLNDKFVPEYRSSELWADTEFSEFIKKDFQVLDILFFHKNDKAYGAHVAVYLGNNKAIHISKKNKIPVIWELETFLKQPEYQFFLGGKRFRTGL